MSKVYTFGTKTYIKVTKKSYIPISIESRSSLTSVAVEAVDMVEALESIENTEMVDACEFVRYCFRWALLGRLFLLLSGRSGLWGVN